MRTLDAILGAAALLVVLPPAVSEGLNPPLVDMKEHFDPKKLVSIQLPVNWKDEGPRDVIGGVQRWSGFFQQPNADGPDAQIECSLRPTCSRAELAFWSLDRTWPGKATEGSIRRGEGWVEQARSEGAGPRGKAYIFRLVENEGRVFELVAYGSSNIFSHIDGHLHAVFDTFKVLGKAVLAKPPEGYAVSNVDGTEVWTDTKDKKTLQRVITGHAAAWAATAQALPGGLSLADAPVLVVCDKDPVYQQVTDPASSQFSPTCALVYQRRLLAARVGGKANAMFDRTIQQHSSLQFAQHYFGGKVPDWIDQGLAIWVITSLESKGKPEKPPAEYVRGAKAAVAARKETLAVLLDTMRTDYGPDQLESFDMTCYAWHCFFRFGGGAKDFGDRYRSYLEELRKTGSPSEAIKVWDGVDQAALLKSFQTWVASWK